MRKAMLIIPVYYDENVTDGESIASAFDTLLMTVMSTVGILDDYGNPTAGEFLLALDVPWTGEEDSATRLVNLGAIDGPLFAKQRELVFAVATDELHLRHDLIEQKIPLMTGLSTMLDVIADQLHDRYGVPCLLEDEHAG